MRISPSCPFCGSTATVFREKVAQWECSACEQRFAEKPTLPPRRLRDKALSPKHIFFSYGHDDNRLLVDRFQQDFEHRGHTVWVDYKRIGTWDDWRGNITRGIDESHLVVAFMSLHALRDPGVC